jgi:hypothetical protein
LSLSDEINSNQEIEECSISGLPSKGDSSGAREAE